MPFSPETSFYMAPDARPGGAKEIPQTALRVLVLEDDLNNKKLLEAFLALIPAVEFVSTEVKEEGYEAIADAIATGNPFDYVITDLGLKKRGEDPAKPVSDPQGGYEVAAFVRDHLPRARVTLFTGLAGEIRGRKSEDELAAELNAKGIHDLIGKPLLRRDLEATVEKARAHKTQLLAQDQVQQ